MNWKKKELLLLKIFILLIFKFGTLDWLWWLDIRYDYIRTYMFIYKTSRKCINGLSSFCRFILCKCLFKLSLNMFVISEYWQMNRLMNWICNFWTHQKSDELTLKTFYSQFPIMSFSYTSQYAFFCSCRKNNYDSERYDKFQGHVYRH